MIKQQTKQTRSRWLLLCLLSLLMSLGGASTAWADGKALPYSYGFEDYNLATDGWTTQNPSGKNSSEFQIAGAAKKTGSYGFRFSSYSASGENTQYLISPELNAPNGVILSFEYAASSSSTSGEKFKVGYSTNGTDITDFTFGDEISPTSTSWQTYENTFPVGTKYIAVYYYANYQYRLYVDDFSFTAPVSGPALAVADGTTTIASGYIYNFGIATAGSEKTFTLSNPGTEAAPITIGHTGSFGVSPTSTSIPAGESVTLTVTMPDATGDDVITISSTSDAIDDFVINVSGTIRDPNKVYLDFSDGNIPDGWTSVAIGSYASSYGSPWAASTGYISQSGSSSSYEWAFTSPKLTFTNGEVVFFETEKYSSSTWYTPSIKVEYSTDGTSWTTIGSAYTDDTYDIWAKRSVTIPTADAKYIRFSGWYIKLRNIYGGELPNEPKMVVTQPTSLDFGLVDKDVTALTKTFTIANTGKATLSNINVTSANSVFTITNAPTTLAAGASQEVTITMLTANAGALSSLITVSATDMPDATFTVTGCVKPAGMPVEDFASGLPANWTNASWTFANGEATGKSSSAYLTTPKLSFSAGDFIIVKAKRYDSDTSDYLTVQGSSDNGSTWTAYNKKLQDADGLTYPDFGTIVLSDIPTTVNKIRFVGFYAIIDEIHGLNYAPILSVTTGDPAVAVSSPANYDFGECAADATVTYNFANVGAGTINITNVAITGDGATAYSTNWTTSVAAPFDLVITRTYDANRTTAQDATVTVTTSEGDFVINVTGTDKAANAPELAVSTTAIDFGKVTADAVETVTVTNNGTGSMTVDIYSSSSDFTVTPAKLTGIGAGESLTFDITFKYGTPYGVKNGDVVVVPTYDPSKAINITVTGKAKDPATWSEDFAGNVLPTGWDAGANWTIEDGKAKGSWSSSASYLTTPPLTVAATTDELTFDYVTTAGNVSIVIQMSKDGGDWTTCAATPAIPTYMSNGTAGTATITGLEAGSYQFRFKNDDYNLSNFEGFVLNLPDHMASITAYSIPESSSWTVTMKEGQSFEATVTVKEQRGVAEELTAKLYMGDEVIGTQAGSVAANGTETLTIICTPTVAAPSAQMHIEVEWAGTTMSTENVTRYVAAITNLTLDETSSDAVVAGTYDNVTLKRTFNSGWNTICLPFDIDNVDTFFGAGAKAYEFNTYGNDGSLEFSTVSTLTASYPYIVYVPTAITDDIALNNITIASSDASAWYTRKTDSSNNAAYFRGTYAPITAGGWTKNATDDVIYGVTSAGKIAKAGANASMKGFRAYFDLPAGATARLAIYDDATGITTILDAKELNSDGKVYNLNGQRVENAHKGLYIVNGKKVVVK